MNKAVLLGLGASIVVGAAYAARVVLDEEAWRRRLVGYASGDNLRVEIGRLRWSGLGFDAEDVRATYGRPGDRRFVEIRIGRVGVRPEWSGLLGSSVSLRRVIVDEPRVTWTDEEEGRPPPKNRGAFQTPPLAVGSVRVRGGRFTFVRVRRGTRAEIAFDHITGRAGAIATAPRPRNAVVRGRAKARLGEDGEVRLAFAVEPNAPELHADVDVEIDGQNLAELGKFFEPNVGLKMAGRLELGRAHARARGRRLTTSLRAVFEDLDLEAKRTKERSGLQALATNFGIGVGVMKGNGELPEPDQTRVVESARTPDDSVVSFLLGGLRDAAISVTKKPTARALTE